MITDYQWLENNSQIEELLLSINDTDIIAFDSEFERVNTFFPKPALFQLKIKDKYFLLDMKKISNHEVFIKLLDNIVLHAGSEDLEILHNFNNVLPTTIFDTQIAASLCGYGLHFSYQNIVKELLGVELSKAHSRSDWMQRPLSSEQLQYAIDDVVYLPEIKTILQTKLKELDRVTWFKELMKQRTDSIINSNHVNKTFLKLVKSKRLDSYQQQLLYSLLLWREKVAIKRDKPRPWIIKDHEIIAIVLAKPQTPARLITDIGLYEKFVKYNGDEIISQYSSCQNINIDKLPKFDNLNPQQGILLKQLKQNLTDRCEKLNIPPALIINVSNLKSLVASGKLLEDIPMWQLINQ